MKKMLPWLFIVFTFFCHFAWGSDPFSTAPAPTQSFHTIQSNTSFPSTPVSNTTQNNSKVTSAALDSGAAILNANPSQLDNNNSADSADMAARIQSVVNDDQAMASAIRAINQNIAVLQQQMLALQTPAQSNNALISWLPHSMQNPTIITAVGCGMLSLLLLVSGVCIGKKIGKRAELNTLLTERRVKSDILEDDRKSEYDFMSSHEAIPAKLDLARAYIAMNEGEQAQMVLKTVIEKGNQEQRSEALSLIQSMLHKQ